MKIFSTFLTLILMAASFSVFAQMSDYEGTYRRGDANLLTEGVKVRLSRVEGRGYDIAPINGNTWSLSLEQLRGAQASTKGIWIYWFEGEGTRNAFFEMSGGSDALASMITKDVIEYNQQPVIEDAEAKARYELYHQQAIQQSK